VHCCYFETVDVDVDVDVGGEVMTGKILNEWINSKYQNRFILKGKNSLS